MRAPGITCECPIPPICFCTLTCMKVCEDPTGPSKPQTTTTTTTKPPTSGAE